MQPSQTYNSRKFHNGSCSAVTRAPTGPLAREIRSTTEFIGFGVIAVSRLSAQNTIRQEDSGILCLPCPALPCPARERRTCPTSTCLFGVLLSSPLVARPDHRLPHETVSRPVDWTTYGPFPILPSDFTNHGKRVAHFSASSLPLSRQYSRRYPHFLQILDE